MLFKLGVIAALVILLLIPSSWIQSLILEREGYQQIERGGIKTSWADTQLVQGPVLMLPYRKLVNETDSNKKMHSHEVVKMLYVLPQALQIKGSVKTERFKKGVYDATGYDSDLDITGSFNKPDLAAAGIEPASVFYDKARLVFSLTDMKGLKNNPVINIQGENHPVEPTKEEAIPFNGGLQAIFSLHAEQGFTFSYKLNLNGSDQLRFHISAAVPMWR